MKRKRKQKEWVVLDDTVFILLGDLEEWLGKPIPANFKSCFRCGRPSIGLICGKQSTDVLPLDEFPLEVQDVLLAIRANWKTNVEAPVCQFHQHGEATN